MCGSKGLTELNKLGPRAFTGDTENYGQDCYYEVQLQG